jgi:hypothetical protein
MLAYRRPVALLGVARDHAANTVYLMHPETAHGHSCTDADSGCHQ